MTELQTSLTFAHEVSHNLGATHDEDEYGNEISGTLMGATLGKNVTISNLEISKKSQQDIRNHFTKVTNGIRYELFKTLDKYPGNFQVNFTKEWSQDDENRLRDGYLEINCLKAKLNYSKDDKHYLKLRKELEKQDNPTTPKPRTKPTPKPTPIQTNTKSTTGSASIDSGSINLNNPNYDYSGDD